LGFLTAATLAGAGFLAAIIDTDDVPCGRIATPLKARPVRTRVESIAAHEITN
jgi:hypothetical protein